MWDSNNIFTAGGASRALVLARGLNKEEAKKFLDLCKAEREKSNSLTGIAGYLNKKDVEYVFDSMVQ